MGHFPILGLPFALAAASTPPYFQAIKWMLTLAGAVIFAAGAVALDNIIKRQRDKRGHNLTQLVNEILAEHQIAYPTFFVALLIAGEFGTDKFWAKDVIGILTFVAFLFYAISVYLTTLHEIIIAKDHQPNTRTGSACTKSLSFWTGVKLFTPTALLAAILLGSGIYFAFAAT